MKRYLIILTLFISGLVGGFELEHWKVAVNYIIEHQSQLNSWDEWNDGERRRHAEATKLDLQYDYYYEHRPIDFLYSRSMGQLAMMKWILTGLGIIFFYLVGAAILKLLFPEWRALRLWFAGYALAVAAAVIIFLLFKMIGHPGHGYAISRKVLGGLQSFVPLMLYIPAGFLLKQKFKHD